MKAELREEAVRLRLKEQLPYGEIRRRLGVSKGTLSAWLRELPLSAERMLELRRAAWQTGELSREKYRATMRKKRDVLDQTALEKYQVFLGKASKRDRFVAGLMLYMAEGAKYDQYNITLTNTDSRPLKFFIGWVREFLDTPKDILRAQLHLYENMDIQKEKHYWKKQLGFTNDQFHKDQVNKLRPKSFTYGESFRHGTCQVRFTSAEKKRELTQAINALLAILC